jgi:lipopolysaccharide export system protein LptA
MRYLGSITAVVALMSAAGWAAAAQTAGRSTPAAQSNGAISPLFSQDSDQPIKITSNSLEVRDKEHQATFVGNVIAVQGDSTLRCKKLVVFYEDNSGPAAAPKPGQKASSNQQIKRLDCKGDVVIVQKDQTATGDNGTFEMKTNKALLTGNVVVTQGENVIRGDQLEIDMTTGVSRIESHNKGRVDALIKPNSPPGAQSGSAPGTAPAAGAKEAKPSAPLKLN